MKTPSGERVKFISPPAPLGVTDHGSRTYDHSKRRSSNEIRSSTSRPSMSGRRPLSGRKVTTTAPLSEPVPSATPKQWVARNHGERSSAGSGPK
jgi:hypothetical protein